jgi:hypothetical protein
LIFGVVQLLVSLGFLWQAWTFPLRLTANWARALSKTAFVALAVTNATIGGSRIFAYGLDAWFYWVFVITAAAYFAAVLANTPWGRFRPG